MSFIASKDYEGKKIYLKVLPVNRHRQVHEYNGYIVATKMKTQATIFEMDGQASEAIAFFNRVDQGKKPGEWKIEPV